MSVDWAGACGRTYYSHPGPLVTAPKLESPWRPVPVPPVGMADMRRALDGSKNLNLLPTHVIAKGSTHDDRG